MASEKEGKRNYHKMLKDDRIDFYLQPKVNMNTGEILGVEVLVRGIDEDGSIICPDDFVPEMEETKEIIDLDFAVIGKVCAYISDRLDLGLPVIPTALNLSRIHIDNEYSAEKIHRIVSKYHVPPYILVFEITERLFVEEFSKANVMIDKLREYGYRVAIDDFGSGYTGLNMLRELNFDSIKLDKCFLSSDAFQAKNYLLLPDVINVAKRMNKVVICEGVEKEEDCLNLLRYGCNIAQGYYFSKPIEKNQFYELYSKLNGFFEVPYIKTKRENLAKPVLSPKAIREKSYINIAILAVLIILICGVVGVVFYVNRVRLMDNANELVKESYEVYAHDFVSRVEEDIFDAVAKAQVFAKKMAEIRSTDKVDDYVNALSYSSDIVSYSYIEKNEYSYKVEDGEYTASDYEKLSSGNVVNSGLIPKQKGNDASFGYLAMDIPVIINGEFVGAFRALMNDDLFVSGRNNSAKAEKTMNVALCDDSGTILAANQNESGLLGQNVAVALMDRGIGGDELNEVGRLLEHGENGSVYLKSKTGLTYYVSIAKYEYVNCKCITLIDGTDSLVSVESLLKSNIDMSFIIISCIICVFLLWVLLINRGTRVKHEEAVKWSILKQFSDTALFVYDYRTDTIEFSDNANEIFRIHEFQHKNVKDFIEKSSLHPDDVHVLADAIKNESCKVYDSVQVRMLHPTEESYKWCSFTFRYVTENGKNYQVIGKVVDIEDAHQHEIHLRSFAHRDGLTDLLNKVTFEKRVRKFLLTDRAGVLVAMDLDGFKGINDKYGHIVGDNILKFVADKVSEGFPNDLVGRIGGDEFAVYIRGEIELDSIIEKVDRINQNLATYNDIPDAERLSLSAGVSRFKDSTSTYDELFDNADILLYKNKNMKRRGSN